MTVTRTLARPLAEDAALDALRQLTVSPVVQVDSRLVPETAWRSQGLKLSFWDTLVIRAAVEGGASRLLSEDLQHGRRVDWVTIENPFH